MTAKSITLVEQITCARREIAFRERVYPRFIEQGKLKPDKAEHELAAMRAVLATLLEVHKEQNPELLG
jgi:hypothetical protein